MQLCHFVFTIIKTLDVAAHPEKKSKIESSLTKHIGETVSGYIRWSVVLGITTKHSLFFSLFFFFSTTPSQEAIPTHEQLSLRLQLCSLWDWGSEVVVRGPQLENVNPDRVWLAAGFWVVWLISFYSLWFAWRLGYKNWQQIWLFSLQKFISHIHVFPNMQLPVICGAKKRLFEEFGRLKKAFITVSGTL